MTPKIAVVLITALYLVAGILEKQDIDRRPTTTATYFIGDMER